MHYRLTSIPKRFVALLIVVSSLNTLNAQLQTALIIRSGMVVQRHQDIPLWGTAGSGAKVFVRMNGVVDSTLANSSGDWQLALPAMNEGGPYAISVYTETEALNFSDVYVGDVWLASGQSNMAWTVMNSDNAAQVIAEAKNQMIRQFLVTRSLGDVPVDAIPAGSSWTPATSEYVGDFSAVGYYYAKHLHEYLGIPIGIINTSFGGTRIESWMSESMLGYDEENIVFGEGESYLQPTVAYNRMLHPLTRVPIKGFIWYQGESNMGSREAALMYTGQLKKLITSWRESWSMGDLPFLWVQIPNTGKAANELAPGSWDALPMLRVAQSRVLSLPNTGEAITIDTGEPDIHPTNKEPVGKRLALVARSMVYGDTILSSGPRYHSHRRLENGKIEITFQHTGQGIVAKDMADHSLRWFSVVGDNGIRYPASAVADSQKVVVWNDNLPNPREIRYAWEYNPHNVNFYNAEDLPAAPFQILIDPPAFGIDFFQATDDLFKQGESTVITWTGYGASEATINGIPVDTIGGLRVWPTSDSTFTLKITSRDNPLEVDSVSIHLNVIEPIPTIELSSDAGNWIAPGSDLTIKAKVSAPEGGTVSQVRFFVNDMRIDSVTQEPFEISWSPDTLGHYHIFGIVSNNSGYTRISDTLYHSAHYLDYLHFEAEEAQIKGGNWIKESEETSAGFYVDFTRDWSVTFPEIEAELEGHAQLSIRFKLDAGGQRIQDLYINDLLYESISFAAPTENKWETLYMIIPLKAGSNKISLVSNWGYFSLDYMHFETITDSLQSPVIQQWAQKDGLVLYQNHPNPFQDETCISFQLPAGGFAQIKCYDMAGREAGLLMNRYLDQGYHEISINEALPEDGVYYLKLSFNGEFRVVKMLKF